MASRTMGFFDMPREIRDEIYKHALTPGVIYIPTCPEGKATETGVQLLATCRQAYDEGFELYYGKNTFRISSPCCLWTLEQILGSYQPIHLCLMQRLIVELGANDIPEERQEQLWRSVCKDVEGSRAIGAGAYPHHQAFTVGYAAPGFYDAAPGFYDAAPGFYDAAPGFSDLGFAAPGFAAPGFAGPTYSAVPAFTSTTSYVTPSYTGPAYVAQGYSASGPTMSSPFTTQGNSTGCYKSLIDQVRDDSFRNALYQAIATEWRSKIDYLHAVFPGGQLMRIKHHGPKDAEMQNVETLENLSGCMVEVGTVFRRMPYYGNGTEVLGTVIATMTREVMNAHMTLEKAERRHEERRPAEDRPAMDCRWAVGRQRPFVPAAGSSGGGFGFYVDSGAGSYGCS